MLLLSVLCVCPEGDTVGKPPKKTSFDRCMHTQYLARPSHLRQGVHEDADVAENNADREQHQTENRHQRHGDEEEGAAGARDEQTTAVRALSLALHDADAGNVERDRHDYEAEKDGADDEVGITQLTQDTHQTFVLALADQKWDL